MNRFHAVMLLAIGVTIGGAVGYQLAHNPASIADTMAATQAAAQSPDRKIIYYRDPSGAPYWSAEPKKDANGRDYLPVYEDEEPTFGPGGVLQKPTRQAGGRRRILYYRNPMGLPDTSPVPKKDPMGMDYVPVYEDEAPTDANTVKVSLEKVQRSGVRTEVVEPRAIVQPVRAIGTVMHDDARLTIVTMRSDGFIEALFVNRTGQHVQAGEPLFRVYSPEIQRAQIDFLYGGSQDGPIQRLRNLGVPESHISAVQQSRKNLRTVDWLAPVSGDVIEKRVINGQYVKAGDELYRIADHSHLWVIADVAEADLPAVKIGTRANVTVRAYAAEPIEGEVTFIYPELRAETRTARVRVEVPNPDGRLKIDMYADVVFEARRSEQPAIAVPTSAVIDSGTRQVVLVAKGEGRFEPRPVKLGRRGDAYVEVLDGISVGEEVVTAATFLIDAESNLRAALRAFTQPETP